MSIYTFKRYSVISKWDLLLYSTYHIDWLSLQFPLTIFSFGLINRKKQKKTSRKNERIVFKYIYIYISIDRHRERERRFKTKPV